MNSVFRSELIDLCHVSLLQFGSCDVQGFSPMKGGKSEAKGFSREKIGNSDVQGVPSMQSGDSEASGFSHEQIGICKANWADVSDSPPRTPRPKTRVLSS